MLWIAHRSGPANFPEQTIASAREALSLGADMVEIDLRFTADKRLAVTHDRELARVFGEEKNVDTMTGEEFLALRHKKDCCYGSHLFEHYLACGVAPLLIHIKEQDTIGEILRLIDVYGYRDKVVMGVANVASVEQIRAYAPEIKILSFGPSPEAVPSFIEAGVDYIRLWEGWLTPELAQLVKDSPADLWVMSGGKAATGFRVGEPPIENLRKILTFEPDGVLINDMRLVKAL